MTELVSKKFFIDKRHELNLRRGKVGRIISVSRDDFQDSGQEAINGSRGTLGSKGMDSEGWSISEQIKLKIL